MKDDQTPTPSRSDPTPERRIGDASMRPVIIAVVVAILIILIGAIILIKVRQTKVIPRATEPHPTTQMIPYTQATVPLSLAA
jgi:hypothetical protein